MTAQQHRVVTGIFGGGSAAIRDALDKKEKEEEKKAKENEKKGEDGNKKGTLEVKDSEAEEVDDDTELMQCGDVEKNPGKKIKCLHFFVFPSFVWVFSFIFELNSLLQKLHFQVQPKKLVLLVIAFLGSAKKAK